MCYKFYQLMLYTIYAGLDSVPKLVSDHISIVSIMTHIIPEEYTNSVEEEAEG